MGDDPFLAAKSATSRIFPILKCLKIVFSVIEKNNLNENYV